MAAAAAAPAPSINRSSAEPVAAPGCFRWVRLCARCVCAVCAVPQSGTERSPGSAPLCPQSCGRWGRTAPPLGAAGAPRSRAGRRPIQRTAGAEAVRCGAGTKVESSGAPGAAQRPPGLETSRRSGRCPPPPPSDRAFPVMQPGLPPPGYGAPSRPARGAPRPAPLRPRHRRPFKAPPRPPLPAASDRSARPP